MNNGGKNIGLVSWFGGSGPKGGETLLSALVKILSSISDNTYVIATNTSQRDRGNIYSHAVKYDIGENIFTQALNQLTLQLKISYKLARLSRKVKVWVFFGGEGLLLPMLTAKLFGGEVALALAGYLEKEGQFKKNILYKPLSLFKRINCRLADIIVIYSQRLIKEWQLEGHKGKIAIAREHFVDFGRFKEQKPLKERDNLIGYIGRLSQEKGILSFIQAISKVAKIREQAAFLIVGDGQLRAQAEEYAKKLNNRVKFVGWVPQDKIPDYINELKLLVLPSYTEGLPNIMLEAMACGTPVLATPVGAIPDVVKDGETGFIMENNCPECIAENIVRALDYPNLEQIACNARALVEKEFTYQAAVAGYRRILNLE